MENKDIIKIESGFLNYYLPFYVFDGGKKLDSRIRNFDSDILVAKYDEKTNEVNPKEEFADYCSFVAYEKFRINKKAGQSDSFTEYTEDGLEYTVRKIFPDEKITKNCAYTVSEEEMEFLEAILEVDIPESGDKISAKLNLLHMAMIWGKIFFENAMWRRAEERRVFGDVVSNSRQYFILEPLLIFDKNNKPIVGIVWLEMYYSGLCILKIQTPLNDVELESDYLKYYSKIGMSNTITNIQENKYSFHEEVDFGEICVKYAENICAKLKVKLLFAEPFLYIGINKSDIKARSFNKYSENIIETIYKAICFPVDDILDIHDRGKDFWKNNYYCVTDDVRYYFSPKGNCISLVSNEMFIKTEKEFGEEVFRITENAQIAGVEVLLHIAMLEKMNDYSLFILSLEKQREFKEIFARYLQIENYILSMKIFSYGTAREMIDQMYVLMPYYFNKTNIKHCITSVEKLIVTADSERREKMQSWIAIAGLIVAIIFTLPLIYETIDIVRNLFGIGINNPQSIPTLKIAFILWIVEIAFIVFGLIRVGVFKKIIRGVDK